MNKDKAQKNMEKVLIKEMRIRIDTYFRIIATQLADIIPKLIGHNLVNSAVRNLQFSVFKKVSAGSIFDMLKEPEHIVKKRETLKRVLETLRNSRKILMRDPDLAYSVDMKENNQYAEMREKDKERKKTAAQEKKKSLLEKASEAASSLGEKIKTGASDLKTKVVGDDSKQTNTSASTRAEPARPTPTTTQQQQPIARNPFTGKSDQDLAVDAAKFAYQNKDAVIKFAKENPELVEKGVKLASQSTTTPAPAPVPEVKKAMINNLFGF